MKNFLNFIKEEIDLRGNPGVPDDFMRKSDEHTRKNLNISIDRMQVNPGQIMNLVRQSVELITTNNGRRLNRNELESRITALEDLAKEVIYDEYGDIIESSEVPVEFNIKLVMPGMVNREIDMDSIPQAPEEPSDEDEESDSAEGESDQESDDQESDDQESNNDDNTILNAAHKKKLLNMITQGEGKATKDIIRYSDTVSEGLRNIFGDRYTELLRIWNEITDIANKLDWDIPIDMKASMMRNQPGGMAGAVELKWESVVNYRNFNKINENKDFTKIVINAVGIDFPMIIHESIKGIYLLLQSSAIKKDKEVAKRVKELTSSFTDESQDFRYGPILQNMFNNFINRCKDSNKYSQMRARVFATIAVDKGRGGLYTDSQFLEIVKSLISVFDKVEERNQSNFVINDARFQSSLAKREIEKVIADIVEREDEYQEELNKYEMEQRFGKSDTDNDEKHDDEDGEFAEDEGGEDEISKLIKKTAEKESDLSNLTQKELQDLIDDALDNGNFDEVHKISQYLKKESREIYLGELKRINESRNRKR